MGEVVSGADIRIQEPREDTLFLVWISGTKGRIFDGNIRKTRAT